MIPLPSSAGFTPVCVCICVAGLYRLVSVEIRMRGATMKVQRQSAMDGTHFRFSDNNKLNEHGLEGT